MLTSSKFTPLWLVVAAFAALAAGCSKQPRQSSEKQDAAALAVGVRHASADSVWAAMLSSNDRKIATTTYFLNLVRYTNITDTAAIQRVRMMNDSLKALRYDQTNLRNLVDAFDAAENRVLQGVGEVYNANPELQRMMNAAQALEEIKAADDSVLIFRYLYDKAADEYNAALKANAKALKEAEQPMEPLPLFRLNS